MRTVLVIGRHAFGEAPADVLSACKRLAARADTAILGIEFTVGQLGRWTFTGATLLPDLRIGGEPALDALSEGLQTVRGRP